MKTIPTLTDMEIEILRRGRSDPNTFTDYFFRPYGASQGFKFDDKFDKEGAWQIPFITMAQKDGRISGGVGTGKTLTVGMGAVWLACTVHPDFKFMNVAPTALQSQWMYDIILSQAANTPFERLIFASPARPYPKIEIKFKVYDTVVHSKLFFMSVDKNARNILTFEGDWINVDEAGLIDDLQSVMVSLGSRLRGSYRGRERMGRLTLTTNPWDNPYFWYLFDLAQGDPVNNLSMVVSTRHNHNVTKEQLDRILARIPASERDQFINGTRPEGRGNFFSRESIYACEDEEWGDMIEAAAAAGKEGYAISRLSGSGVNYYQTPRKPNPPLDDDLTPTPIYIILGDPGTDGAPNRNAPAIGVWEVGNFPTDRAEMVAMWWGQGNGSIAPFLVQLARFVIEYQPSFVGIDSTGTQKNMAETLNELLKQKDGEGYTELFGEKFKFPEGFKVRGLDFSGSKKASYLVACQFLLETELFRWPKNAVCMRSQLSNYDPMLDRTVATSKVPQDLVAMLAMTSWVIRRWFNVDIQEWNDNATQTPAVVYQKAGRSLRNDRSGRSRRAYRSDTPLKPNAEVEPEGDAEAIPNRNRKKIIS